MHGAGSLRRYKGVVNGALIESQFRHHPLGLPYSTCDRTHLSAPFANKLPYRPIRCGSVGLHLVVPPARNRRSTVRPHGRQRRYGRTRAQRASIGCRSERSTDLLRLAAGARLPDTSVERPVHFSGEKNGVFDSRKNRQCEFRYRRPVFANPSARLLVRLSPGDDPFRTQTNSRRCSSQLG